MTKQNKKLALCSKLSGEVVCDIYKCSGYSYCLIFKYLGIQEATWLVRNAEVHVKGKGLEGMEGKEATGSWCVMEPSSFTFWDIVKGSPSVTKKKILTDYFVLREAWRTVFKT